MRHAQAHCSSSSSSRVGAGQIQTTYRPLTETPQWTAWGAILELAIRRAAAAYIGRPRAWLRPTADIEVVAAPSPTIAYRSQPFRGRRQNQPPVRRALTITLSNFRRRFSHSDADRLFAARPPVVWQLQPHTAPWWTASDAARPTATPEARVIWQWAAFPHGSWDASADPAIYFEDAINGSHRQPA